MKTKKNTKDIPLTKPFVSALEAAGVKFKWGKNAATCTIPYGNGEKIKLDFGFEVDSIVGKPTKAKWNENFVIQLDDYAANLADEGDNEALVSRLESLVEVVRYL